MKKLLIHFKDYRISYRLLCYILLCSSFFTILATTVQLYTDYNRDVEGIHNSINHIKKGYLETIAGNLWAINTLQLRKNIEGISKLQDIQYIEVREKIKGSEIIVAAIGTPKDANVISKSFPLFYGKENNPIGTLLVVASKEGAFKRLQERILLILTTQALQTFFVSISILLIFYIMVMRHLNYLTKYFKNFGLDKLEVPLSIKRYSDLSHPDEFGRLVNSVNLMRTGLKQNIEERERSEKALTESKEKYTQLFNSSNDAIFVHEMKNIDFVKFSEVNDLACQRLEYTRQELLRMSPAAINAGDMNEFGHLAMETLEKKGQCVFEMVHIGKSGKKIPVEISGSTFENKGKRYVLSIARDISDRKLLESRLQQAQKMESIGNLAGGIAHDFNNILFPIVGMSELLLDDLPSGSFEHKCIREIFDAGIRGSELVKQILAFSRKSEHKMTPVKVQAIVKEVLKLSRATIPVDIEIHPDIREECGPVNADATQIHQICMNLITNAFHAVEENNGEIFVELKEVILDKKDLPDSLLPSGKYVLLTVSDNGVGISQEMQAKIFEPYFTTKKRGKGTGLGLAVVFGIIKKHGGDIKVYSEAGKGSTFKVYLPLIEEQDSPERSAQNAVLKKGKERILLVDDEKAVAALEKQMLERLGYQVTSFTGSVDALEAFRDDPGCFDMVISDMTMPKMTGDRLTKELIKTRPDIPIIICTGFSERINQEKAELLGIKGFLMKPVTMNEMASMVRKVLDERRNPAV